MKYTATINCCNESVECLHTSPVIKIFDTVPFRPHTPLMLGWLKILSTHDTPKEHYWGPSCYLQSDVVYQQEITQPC